MTESLILLMKSLADLAEAVVALNRAEGPTPRPKPHLRLVPKRPA